MEQSGDGISCFDRPILRDRERIVTSCAHSCGFLGVVLNPAVESRLEDPPILGGLERSRTRFWGNNRGGFPGSRKWLQGSLFLGRHLCHYGATTGTGSSGSGGGLGASPFEAAALDDEC